MKRTHGIRRPRPRAEAGITLIEALVALLVLAIGMLGLAGLQVRGLSYNHDAFVRSQATILAYDMMELMRLRKVQSNSGAAALAALTAYTNPPADDAECDPLLATEANEVACWYGAVFANLPGATEQPPAIVQTQGGGTVTVADDLYGITLSWVDRSVAVDAADDVRFITQTWEFQP